MTRFLIHSRKGDKMKQLFFKNDPFHRREHVYSMFLAIIFALVLTACMPNAAGPISNALAQAPLPPPGDFFEIQPGGTFYGFLTTLKSMPYVPGTIIAENLERTLTLHGWAYQGGVGFVNLKADANGVYRFVYGTKGFHVRYDTFTYLVNGLVKDGWKIVGGSAAAQALRAFAAEVGGLSSMNPTVIFVVIGTYPDNFLGDPVEIIQ